mmetsp:Transcript_159138/g.296562  ORF Transcript_159138/g.296562 Transcript_159138/m.296562 type:complete len:363 (-) Transcript_159138:124-1212(-)
MTLPRCISSEVRISTLSFFTGILVVISGDQDREWSDAGSDALAPKGSSLLQLSRGKSVGSFDSSEAFQNAAGDNACESLLHNLFNETVIPKHLKGLHKVVGPDGVLMITLARHPGPTRFGHSAKHLRSAGIYPVPFVGTDGVCSSEKMLNLGCADQETGGWCSVKGKVGLGCVSKNEQAIADSHRRALLLAQERSWNWTMVMEDDVVPVWPAQWMRAFRKAWSKVPPQTKIVRFNWCFNAPKAPAQLREEIIHDAGFFQLVRWTGVAKNYYAGGCTGAYMVHKSIIPELVNLFPCCCAVDCCFENELFDQQVEADGTTRGMQILLNMDSSGSVDYRSQAGGHENERGSIIQDIRELPSTKLS